jgi:hypothetical protein
MLHPELHAFCSSNKTSSRPMPMPRWLGAAGERTEFACTVTQPSVQRPSSALA